MVIGQKGSTLFLYHLLLSVSCSMMIMSKSKTWEQKTIKDINLDSLHPDVYRANDLILD